MKVLSCLNPKVVFNRSLGRTVVARCGKCEACINAKAANWVQRLDQEMYFSPFTFFVTFQYDEFHVKQYIRLRDEDNPNTLPSYIDYETGQFISLSDVSDVKEKDIRYCEETKILLVPDFTDFQKFIKRLRKDINKCYGNETKIRYYCTFEIGPTTFRPHAHSLFFLDSSLLAQDFGDLCRKHWTNGSVYDPHIVVGSASQYVASYVNCLANLPAIYLSKEIRPKSLFSKCPIIGYRALPLESRKELLFKQENAFTLYSQSFRTFSDVPLWRSFRNSIYRFIVKFSSLSYLDRIEVYRLGRIANESYGIDIIIRETIRLGYYINFYTLVRGTNFFRYNEDSFKRFISTISHAYQVCKDFGISVEYYVYLLSEFYDKEKSEELKNYLLAQNEYFKNHDVSDYLLLNREFCLNVNNKLYDDLEPYQKYYLDFYMGDLDKTKPIHLNYRSSYAYNELYKLHSKIAYDNTKTKQATDYLMAHRDKFQNIINYKNS